MQSASDDTLLITDPLAELPDDRFRDLARTLAASARVLEPDFRCTWLSAWAVAATPVVTSENPHIARDTMVAVLELTAAAALQITLKSDHAAAIAKAN